MEDRVVRGGNRPALTRLPPFRVTSRRKMASILKKIVGQHLRPSRFLQGFLLGNAPKVVIREDAHAGEVQLASQAPRDFGRDIAKPAFRGFISENYAEEN